MDINTKEMREIVREIWTRLYFDHYGAYRDGIDKFSQVLEEELDAYDKKQSEMILANFKEAK